jgi:hypothetical protein
MERKDQLAGSNLVDTNKKKKLSYPLLSTDHYLFAQPLGAATSNAQVPARSGSSISDNRSPASCDKNEAFSHEFALYSPFRNVRLGELRALVAELWRR